MLYAPSTMNVIKDFNANTSPNRMAVWIDVDPVERRAYFCCAVNCWSSSIPKDNDFWNMDNIREHSTCSICCCHISEKICAHPSVYPVWGLINTWRTTVKRKTCGYRWCLVLVWRKLQEYSRNICRHYSWRTTSCISWRMSSDAVHEIKASNIWGQVLSSYLREDVIFE